MEWINNEVQRTLEKVTEWNPNSSGTTVAGQGFWTDFHISGTSTSKQRPYVFYTKLYTPRITNLISLFSGNCKIQYINVDDAIEGCTLTSLKSAFSGTNMYCMLKGINFGINTDYSNVTSCSQIFSNSGISDFIVWGNLKDAPIQDWSSAFGNCRQCPNIIDFEFAPFVSNATNFNDMFYYGGGTFAGSMTAIKGLDVINGTTFGRFLGARNVGICEIKNWKQGNFDFTQQTNTNTYIINTMKYMIFHAVNSEDGATNRSMTLHSTPKNKWLNDVANTTPTAEDVEILGVEDWDRYGDLTWAEIASSIKDITIA